MYIIHVCYIVDKATLHIHAMYLVDRARVYMHAVDQRVVLVSPPESYREDGVRRKEGGGPRWVGHVSQCKDAAVRSCMQDI